MGLTKSDLAKVPHGLSQKEYYARIYTWHRQNKEGIFARMANRDRDDPFTRCYFELVEALPDPEIALSEDVALICREVISGLMEWAYHSSDKHGVKTAAYAHHILDTFFDGFNGERTLKLAQNSKLFPEHSMSNCLARYRE